MKISNVNMIVRGEKIPVRHDGFELEYGKEEVVKISLAGYKDFHPLEVSVIEVIDISDKSYKINTKHLRHKIRH